MEAIQAALEQACTAFQNPATQQQAEHVLLQFRQQPNLIPICQHIIEHSTRQDARFQAVLALREALLREWAGMSAEQVRALQGYLLQRTLSGPAADAATEHQAAVVRNTLMAVLSVAVKRGWLDQAMEARAALLHEIMSIAASGGGGMEVSRMALQLLDAIVAEFNLPSATPLGLAWDYHECCAREMEDTYLRTIFATAANLARHATTSGSPLTGEDGGVAAAAAKLMATCLQWEYKRGMPGHSSLAAPASKGRTNGGVSLNPGESWTALLLAPDTTEWVVSCLERLRAMYGPPSAWSSPGCALSALPQPRRAHVVALGAATRQLLCALCAVAGDVFPKGDQEPRIVYLRTLTRGLLPWVWPPHTSVTSALSSGVEDSELLEACRCLTSLAPVHRARALQQAGSQAAAALGALTPPGPGGSSPDPSSWLVPGSCAPGFLGLLEALTLCLIRSGGVSASGSGASLSGVDDEDRFWLHECTEMLLEPERSILTAAPDNSHLPLGVVAAAAAVFTATIQSALEDAAKSAHEEVSDAHEEAAAAGLDDWMARAAILARHNPAATFTSMSDALEGAQHRLYSAAVSGADPSQVLEQLCWLVRMTSHCLADSGAGETPLVPLPLLMAIEGGAPGAGEATVRLSNTLLALPQLVLNPQARPVMSPRLMEVCIWAMARWADTYLFPEEPLPGPLQQVFGDSTPHSSQGGSSNGGAASHQVPTGTGGHGTGAALLDMAVQVANTCLTSYPGEVELHRQVVTSLLPVLVRRCPVCERLIHLPAWQALTSAFASRQPVLATGLQQKMLRALSQSLCMVGGAVPRTAAAHDYITRLLGPATEEVIALSSRPDLASIASRADVAVQLGGLLETFRGATRATLSRTQPPLFALVSRLLQPLLTLQHAFRAHTGTVALVLKLAAEVVEYHVSYLRPAEVDTILRWVLAILQQYAATNTWAARLAASRTQEEQSQVEAARDLRALLRLLGHVTQRDIAASALDGTPNSPASLDAATAANSHRHAGAEQPTLDTGQVVLAGLNILLPLISTQLLKFPKIPRLYFNLLAYMLENYAEQVASVEPHHFATLMSSLDFGLNMVSDNVVLQSALEGLAGLARYQQHRAAVGSPALVMAGGPESSGQTVSAHFMELLLRRLLLSDCPPDMVEQAADALQPLIITEPQAYTILAGRLVQQAQQQDMAAGSRISNSLASLVAVASSGGQPGAAQHGPAHAGRQSKRVFRQTVCQVVSDVRGLLQVR